ncbi:hypothetical protein VNO80_02932 [Phaseolus coccineus]|uniref:Uncharacterized protein n=1 Tax=Phaseolus coccineus TaxID=3886 RepID=A0AAN9NQT4_PHACN
MPSSKLHVPQKYKTLHFSPTPPIYLIHCDPSLATVLFLQFNYLSSFKPLTTNFYILPKTKHQLQANHQ